MLRGIFQKRDIVILSVMICFGIVFFVFALLAPRQQKHHQGKSVVIQSKTVQPSTTYRSNSFKPSHKVEQGTSLSVPQAEEMERDDEILAPAQDITKGQIEENTLPSSAEDASADVLDPDEEQTETEEETYPVGDLRRLTPQERIHYQKLIEEMQALDRERKTWIDLDLPFEEWSARQEADYKHARRVGGQIAYYLKKLGYPPPFSDRWGLLVDPYVDGDFAQK